MPSIMAGLRRPVGERIPKTAGVVGRPCVGGGFSTSLAAHHRDWYCRKGDGCGCISETVAEGCALRGAEPAPKAPHPAKHGDAHQMYIDDEGTRAGTMLYFAALDQLDALDFGLAVRHRNSVWYLPLCHDSYEEGNA